MNTEQLITNRIKDNYNTSHWYKAQWLRTQWKEFRGLILFILLMTIFRSALADWNAVPTGSMLPTIVEGDRILVNKMAYDLRIPFSHTSLLKLADPQRGDIIVFDSDVSDIRLVKRVVAVPGDVVQMQNNRLTINGQLLQYQQHDTVNRLSAAQLEPYIELQENLLGVKHRVRIAKAGSRSSTFSPLVIPHDRYLALGDNRDNSADSRVIGLIPRKEIIGRTRSVVMSLNYDNYYLPRSDRFLQPL